MAQKILKREDILNVEDVRREMVHVPEWGGDVIVRSMTAAQRIAFEQELIKDQNLIRPLIVCFSVVDENDELQFKPEDARLLLERNYAAILPLSDAAFRLSGLRRPEVDKAKENFPETQGDASPSD